MIRVSELQKQFGSTTAVDGMSFQVSQGETFGLLGPNGAGKTTTINMLVGVLAPDAGTVTVNGEADPGRADVRRCIGIAPQTLSLYEEFSARENLTFFARLYEMPSQSVHERVEWSLRFAGLLDRHRDRVKTFSGGMKRRLNLACALVHDPLIILLDEPTVGVDPQSRNHLFESIEQLKSEKRTILYTTHYMEEAERLCDRVAIMDHGRILALDTVDRLIERYGGRSVVTATLKEPPPDPSVVPGDLNGLSLRFDTETPLEDVGRLTAGGVALSTLNVARPDLEMVFLVLTGRRLRD